MEAVAKNTVDKTKSAATKKIAIVTCCLDDLGGSEDLWWHAALHLNELGLEIMVLKLKINSCHSKFTELSGRGIVLKELDFVPKKSRPEEMFMKVWNKLRKVDENHRRLNFYTYIKDFRPDHVLIAQGINFDGVMYAQYCETLGIPFSIVCQKAVEFYWPQPWERSLMKEAFQKAERCFFVSRHNRQLTEEQFGFRFRNAQIVCNPVKTKRELIVYPSDQNGLKLACIGRLFIIDKGQDILLRVLSQEKWKQRQISVSFIGTGVDEKGLKELAALLGVTNIEFKGHVDDIEGLWREHHALVLPSRSEGLPLVVLEAMSVGRMVIAAKAGGVEEVIEDGKTGFLAEANVSSFDQALERAWQHRHEWEMMGRNAFESASAIIPEAPEIDFANVLLKLVYES